MSLFRLQSVFRCPVELNEIELINHVHKIRSLAKENAISGLITYRASMFACLAEGRMANIEAFEHFLTMNYSLLDKNTLSISTRKYPGVHMNFVSDEFPIVNDPMVDWSIEDKKYNFPYELLGKILELSKKS